MPALYPFLAAIVFTTGTYAVFPDCINGPLKSETICDRSASKLPWKIVNTRSILTKLDALDRAKSLVALYSLEEKINATSSGSPGVSRLGIPPYQWWNEGLHGMYYTCS
jgi:beta-D-xylosidase 4